MAHEGESPVERQIAFLVEADKLKRVLRQSAISGKQRRENSAEHSWHITLMALVLAEHAAAPDLDLFKVLRMLILHDLVEIDAGDTFVYDEEARKGQKEREERAAERIFGLLPRQDGVRLRAVWDEFEAHESPEAKFARALDRLQPLLLNYVNEGFGWQRHGVRATQVRNLNRIIADGSPELWHYASELIDDAVRRGYLDA